MAFAAAQQPQAVGWPCPAQTRSRVHPAPLAAHACSPARATARRPAHALSVCCSRVQDGDEASTSGSGRRGADAGWLSGLSQPSAAAVRAGGVTAALFAGWCVLPAALPAHALSSGSGGGGGDQGGGGGGGGGGSGGGGGGDGHNVVAELAADTEEAEADAADADEAAEEEEELGRCACCPVPERRACCGQSACKGRGVLEYNALWCPWCIASSSNSVALWSPAHVSTRRSISARQQATVVAGMWRPAVWQQ